jgi:hypothetical protein
MFYNIAIYKSCFFHQCQLLYTISGFTSVPHVQILNREIPAENYLEIIKL